jgi:hypothetical protein
MKSPNKSLSKIQISIKKHLVGGAIIILKNDGVRQWEG